MNWVEAGMRREFIRNEKKISGLFALEAERDFYREILLECKQYVPDVDPHGVDKRVIEEALGPRAVNPQARRT